MTNEEKLEVVAVLERVGIWRGVCRVVRLLDSSDGQGKGDQRWRNLSTSEIAAKAYRHFAAKDSCDPDSGLPHVVHAASRMLMLATVEARPRPIDETLEAVLRHYGAGVGEYEQIIEEALAEFRNRKTIPAATISDEKIDALVVNLDEEPAPRFGLKP